jgi:cob(I)alamin adenosyltransferase
MRITRVYTRTGDAGKTRLAGGEEVWKDDLRVEAYGTVDELNAVVGMARAFNVGAKGSRAARARLEQELRWIQNKLFDIGGLLATAPGRTFGNMPRVTANDVARLERFMDECQRDLKPLQEFLLPGGGQVAACLHQARTVCRRAERRCVQLARRDTIDPLVTFLNRLSDSFFVLARWVAKTRREPEFLWERSPEKD